jgi:hypothetical protein
MACCPLVAVTTCFFYLASVHLLRFRLFDGLGQAPDVNGTTLKTGYIDSFRITFQKQVAATTLASFELDDV